MARSRYPRVSGSAAAKAQARAGFAATGGAIPSNALTLSGQALTFRDEILTYGASA